MNQSRTEKILGQTREIYNQIAPDFSDTRSKWWKGFGSFNKYIKAGDKVLDLGCGNGRMAEIFADSKIQYLGIDNSEELIKIARERFKDKPWARFEVGDITLGDGGTVYPISVYNLVLLIAVLHHIPTKKLRLKILKDIYKSLQPGGRLVISNWNLFTRRYFKKYVFTFYNLKNKIKHNSLSVNDAFVPWKRSGQPQARYVHSFTKGEVTKLLRQAGFEVENISYEPKDGVVADRQSGENLLAVAVKR